MHAKEKTGLGIHMSVDGVRASLAAGGQITQLALIEPVAGFLSWLCLPGGRMACAAAPELIGVEGKDHDAGKALLEVFRRLKEAVPPERHDDWQVAIAVPRALPEPQRRRLLNAAQEFFGEASLLDSTTAALHAAPAPSPDGSGTAIAIVAEDMALEMCVSAPDAGSYRILGYRSVPELSGHALHHHLLQTAIDRLPVAIQERMAADDETLSKLLITVLRTRSMLSRLGSITCPLAELDSPPPNVTFAAKDVTSWMEPRLESVGTALNALAKEVAGPIDRVLLVGGWGEWPSFLSWFERRFDSPLVYRLECVADGAALAAAAAPAQRYVAAAPGPLTSMSELLAGLTSFVTFAPSPPSRTHSPEDKLEDFFSDIAQLVAERKLSRVRQLLAEVKRLTETVLAALDGDAQGAGLRSAAPAPAASEASAPDDYPPQSEYTLAEMPRNGRRLFEEAERLLSCGRILEAVGSSHLAHQNAPGSHDALLYMLDIHRRAAQLLAASGDHAVAETQLRCALRHRQGDERTRRALGQLLLQEAAFQEKNRQNYDEAKRLYEDALDCVDDDAVAEIVKSLERLQQLRDSRG